MSGTATATFVLAGIWLAAGVGMLTMSGVIIGESADPEEAAFSRIVLNTFTMAFVMVGGVNLAAALGIHLERPWGTAVAYAAIPINVVSVIGIPWAITHMVALKKV